MPGYRMAMEGHSWTVHSPLTVHGANFLAVKTRGTINQRARRIARIVSWLLVVLTIASLLATAAVRPQMVDNYILRKWGASFPASVMASLGCMIFFRAKGRDLAAFLASSGYIVGMLGGAAFGLYPYLLPASTDEHHSLTIYNSSAGVYGLTVGLVWWVIGVALALGYFALVYRSICGKVTLEGEDVY